MERHEATRGQLESRHALLATYHKALGAERDSLGQRADSLSAANVALTSWLKENAERPVVQVRRAPDVSRFGAPHWWHYECVWFCLVTIRASGSKLVYTSTTLAALLPPTREWQSWL